jgi:MFS family permease
MPLFSLSAAHANDHAEKGEFVLVNAALMLFYSFGAIGGPLAASLAMQRFGPQSLFLFCAVVYAVYLFVIVLRMQARAPATRRSRFVAMLRTSPVFARLARRGEERSPVDGGSRQP